MSYVRCLLALLIALSATTPVFAQAPVAAAQAPVVDPPQLNDQLLQVAVPNLVVGYKLILEPFANCNAGARPLGKPKEVPRDVQPQDKIGLYLFHKLKLNDTLCVAEEYRPISGGTATPPMKGPIVSGLITVTAKTAAKPTCPGTYNDCNWGYTAVAGAEQSATSAQNSQTNAFVDLFLRSPRSARGGNIWTEVRFLGAPNTSNTQGIVAIATDASGNVTSNSIATVGAAVDYVLGYQWDFPISRDHPFSLGLIGAFGATTPLSSKSASIAYAVPAYGSNECTQLQARFGVNATTKPAYTPPFPGAGQIHTTTQVTTGGTTTTSMSTSPFYCSVNPGTNFTTNSLAGTTVVTTTDGTQITTIAFSPEDRSSFLLKYLVGLRFVDRQRSTGKKQCSVDDPDALSDNCSRSVTDFSIGQDQIITGGYLRHLVLKVNTEIRIPGTFMYFYASAAVRTQRNQTLSPLLLSPVQIAGTAGAGSTAVTIPSPQVFVLPLRQSDRDFYRFGIAVDLNKVLPKLFTTPAAKTDGST